MSFGNIDVPHSDSSMPDVARGLAALGERENPLGQDWLLPVAPARSTRDTARLVGEAMGRPVPIVSISSVDQAKTLGLLDPVFADEFAELFYQHTEPQIVDSSAAESAFGLRATPFEEALASTVDWDRGVLAAAA